MCIAGLWLSVAAFTAASPADEAFAAEPPPAPVISAAKDDWTTQVSLLSHAPVMLNLVAPTNVPPTAEVSVGRLVTDSVAVVALAGFALGGNLQGGAPSWGFGAGFGVDVLFRKPTDTVRPMLLGDLRLLKLVSAQPDDIAAAMRYRVGVEFFVLRWLSLRAAAGVEVALAFKSGAFALGLLPFDIGAGLYF